MNITWMNDRQALPPGHAKAGQIGLVIDFEDGVSEPQRVYAANESEMNDKLAKNYGNTRNTVMKLRQQPAAPAPPPAAPGTPPAPPPAPSNQRMTAAEKIQAVDDLDDPAKASAALARLMGEEGFDIDEAKADQRRRRAEKEANANRDYHAEQIRLFMADNPEYVGTPKNAKLLRDRTFARAGAKPTAADWEKSYEELLEMDVLDSTPLQQQPPATPPAEPSAPPPVEPRGSTGARPSQLQRTTGPGPAGKRMTRSEALDLAESDDYIDRLQREPGLKERIEQALKTPG